jgi:hypothetical protein
VLLHLTLPGYYNALREFFLAQKLMGMGIDFTSEEQRLVEYAKEARDNRYTHAIHSRQTRLDISKTGEVHHQRLLSASF